MSKIFIGKWKIYIFVVQLYSDNIDDKLLKICRTPIGLGSKYNFCKLFLISKRKRKGNIIGGM